MLVRSRRKSYLAIVSAASSGGADAACASMGKPTKIRAAGNSDSTPQDSPPRPGRRLLRLLFRRRVLMTLAALAAAAVLYPRLVERLSGLRQRDEYRLAVSEIEVTPPLPRHVPADFIRQAARDGGLPETISVLDRDVTGRVARAFSRHPWVAGVRRVRKSFPARIVVELDYRTPAAVVEIAGEAYPIDAEGVLLPAADFSPADIRSYPPVRGVISPPAGPPGALWDRPQVVGAAKLAAAIGPDWWDLGLAVIEIASTQPPDAKLDEIIYHLTTTGGSQIVWGRAPGTLHPGELTAEQKIGRLKKYLADFGGFESPHGPCEIDIRHWREITRRPLSAARERSRR